MNTSSTCIASLLAITLAVPHSASADVKDALIGGAFGAAIGAIVTNEVHKNRQNTQTRSSTTTSRSSTQASRPAQQSLNGTYDRSERVQIQSALQARGITVGTIDGVLGRNSRAAISQFQASLGEPATGQLTRAQYQILVGGGAAGTASTRSLLFSEVVLLQQGLHRLGLYRLAIDGKEGPGTRGATNNFLAMQGYAPGTTTPVQNLVMVAAAAGIPLPPHLAQQPNAGTTMAVAPGSFGTQGAQQPPAFGAQGATQQPSPFGTQGTQQASPFGTQGGQPAPGSSQAAFGTARQQATAPSTQSMFGSAPAGAQHQATQPQAVGTQPRAAPDQPLFAPSGAAQPSAAGGTQTPVQGGGQPQPPAPVQPAQGATPLFASTGNPAAQAAAPSQAPAQSGLDIFSSPAAPQPAAPQSEPATAPQTVAPDPVGDPNPVVSTSGTAILFAPATE